MWCVCGVVLGVPRGGAQGDRLQAGEPRLHDRSARPAQVDRALGLHEGLLDRRRKKGREQGQGHAPTGVAPARHTRRIAEAMWGGGRGVLVDEAEESDCV